MGTDLYICIAFLIIIVPNSVLDSEWFRWSFIRKAVLQLVSWLPLLITYSNGINALPQQLANLNSILMNDGSYSIQIDALLSFFVSHFETMPNVIFEMVQKYGKRKKTLKPEIDNDHNTANLVSRKTANLDCSTFKMIFQIPATITITSFLREKNSK